LTALTLTEATSPETFALLPNAQTETTSEKCETFSSGLMLWKNVYDIALAGPRNRFTILTYSGALVVHNCGYQGGLGAFSTMAALYGVNLPGETITALVAAWRKAHPQTKSLWYGCESAAREAVRNPGKNHRVGKLVFRADDGWLRMMLPSERYLCYPNAEIIDGKLTYEGVNQYTRKWERLETYGGKIVENATQAASRDVLAFGMKAAEREGYEVVLHVHDELICETPDIELFAVDKLAQMMSSGPQWALGLPLAAAGFETLRYRKD
jgi:DNA polymerase